VSSPGAFSYAVKAFIRTREKNKCAMCGLRVGDNGQYHHRKPRRAGGTSDERLGLPSNGVLLHMLCHMKVEQNRMWALKRGWLLHAYENPEEVPVRMWHGEVLLVGAGYVPVPVRLTVIEGGGGDGDSAADVGGVDAGGDGEAG